ncbi:response regulator [Roseococcus sp. SYP-B2431]|uniref:response regulator transcription factor n=1 Tax=Roseococcus sp. SYP-B2431 TaxID=2496640 RepID=UPI00103A266D|nr:response regulator [Roseococcus sp. SYP-B2431]TCH99501.1 response regulator [Roseococcus sp. SYP-B2431]
MNRVVHVVDDDTAVRRSLAMLLRSTGHQVETYGSAEALLQTAEAPGGLAQGCIVLDVRMPGMDGLLLMEVLSRRGIRLPVVVVTGHGDIPLAVRAMRAGALDFVEKPYAEERILEAVGSALASSRQVDRQRLLAAQAQAKVGALSPREREVLAALMEGKANKVIGFELGISPRTVEVHRANLMEKLGVRSLPEAVRIGLEGGIGGAG